MDEEMDLIPVKRQCYKTFECPVCQEFLNAPISLCVRGHSICTPCKELSPHCPICRQQFSDSRNITLEHVVDDITFPCKYFENGCRRTKFLRHKYIHEEYCPYRPYACLVGRKYNCHWQGKRADILDHVKTEHATLALMKEKNIVIKKKFRFDQDSQGCQVIAAHGEIFWLQSYTISSKKSYYVSVHYIGPPDNCFKYYYKIHFTSVLGSKHEILFINMTHQDDMEIQNLINDEETCFCLKQDFATYFINAKGTLKYKLELIVENIFQTAEEDTT